MIGCAAAYYLAQGGAKVTLLERGELAGEASGASAGMLAALSGEGADRGAAFNALCADSLDRYNWLIPELAETGVDVRYTRTGVFHLALTEAQAAALQARFERGSMPRGTRLLQGNDILKEEPQANPRALLALLTPDEAYVDSQRLTVALAEAARRLGVSVETGTRLRGFLRSGDRLRGVRTANATLEGDAVLLAAGPWTRALARRLGANVPVRPVRGQMLSLDGPPQPLRHMVWGSDGYLLPREDNQTYVGASVEEAGYRKRTTASVLNRLRRAAIALVPSLSSAKERRAWAGLRPGTPDDLPILGLLPGWQNVWVATGHFRNGILLAPGSASLIAESILAGRPDPRLEPFSPRRFAE